ncbi:MAG TPA: glycine cleavage T C-terminal barrel domain-containing protein [Mycobacteriales bacterium]|nr:glycine cleavage T C-terminal barrel domain-containing protein [Mycobacteriales bacterium]
MTDYSSPLLQLPGAVPADGSDAGVALHYGDPLREQRALAERVGWVDRSHRGVIAIPGADRLTWLHSLTSQHLTELADGGATEALVLSPHGHVEHHMQLADLGGTTWLDVEPGTVEPLFGYLDSMRFWSAVDPADVSPEHALVSLVGPQTPRVLAALGYPDSLPAQGVAPLGRGWVRRMAWPDTDAADLLVPADELTSLAERLTAAGAAPAGSWAFEALRVEARRPRIGFEIDHRTIPHEVGWIGIAVHLDKGCYRGQETVARVHNLGKPPRRLVLLHLDGSSEEMPAQGTPVISGDRQVGFVGTAVRHYELGPIALALVKRNVADDAELQVAGCAAAVDA